MFRHQQKRLFPMALTVLFICLLILPRLSLATVKEVTLFPNSAKVEETAKIKASSSGANNHQAIIILPSQADPESLIVSLLPGSRMKIEDIEIKPLKRADENRIAPMRGQIKRLQTEKNEMQARLQGLDTQLQFWQAQIKAKTKTIADADNLSAAIGRNSRKIYSEKYSVETELGKIDKQLKEHQDKLTQTAGKNEKVWEATITLSGPMQNNSILNYTYMLGDCGWRPLYRLEAIPSLKNILFSWDAEIWQSTGDDWKMAQINLATLQPVRTIRPQDLSQWIIKPRKAVPHKSSRRGKSATAALKAAEADEAEEQSTPVETVNTTYSIWSLGKRTVTAGNRQRLKIKEETWSAQFVFMARPSQSPQAFLQAQIKLSQPVEIPSGQATFIIDGAISGKRNFAFAGSEMDIYFGNSPFITVSFSTTADKSGAAIILQNKQTRQWQWLIEAKNAGNTPIKLRIEEPVPQVRDERIKLTFKHNPEPAEKDNTKFVWVIDLHALQKKSIETGIELEAPKDMNIDFGLRH